MGVSHYRILRGESRFQYTVQSRKKSQKGSARDSVRRKAKEEERDHPENTSTLKEGGSQKRQKKDQGRSHKSGDKTGTRTVEGGENVCGQ